MTSHSEDAARAASALANAPLQSGEPPKDRVFYARQHVCMKWTPYKASSQQARKGIKGRWQERGAYGGWDNAQVPPSRGAWVEDVLNSPTPSASPSLHVGDEVRGPINMLLFCPMCGIQHIDEPEHVLVWTGGSVPEPSHDELVWDNPPHRSHLCHACGCIWRPADVATNGVVRISTVGKADTWGESNSAALPSLSAQDANNEREPTAEDWKHKLWMIACHATGGGIPEIEGIYRSTNDISVQISAHRNEVYQAGNEAGRKEALATPSLGANNERMREAASDVVANAQRSYRSRGEAMMLVPHEDWYRLQAALSPTSEKDANNERMREALEDEFRSMDTWDERDEAVLLLVDYAQGDHPLDDATTAITIGHNNDHNVGDGEGEGWLFAGWCWSHDHYVQGSGTPIGWMPIPHHLARTTEAAALSPTSEKDIRNDG